MPPPTRKAKSSYPFVTRTSRNAQSKRTRSDDFSPFPDTQKRYKKVLGLASELTDELLLEIFSHIPVAGRYATYRSLALVSHSFNRVVSSLLYGTVRPYYNKWTRTLLTTLLNRPGLGRLVRRVDFSYDDYADYVHFDDDADEDRFREHARTQWKAISVKARQLKIPNVHLWLDRDEYDPNLIHQMTHALIICQCPNVECVIASKEMLRSNDRSLRDDSLKPPMCTIRNNKLQLPPCLEPLKYLAHARPYGKTPSILKLQKLRLDMSCLPGQRVSSLLKIPTLRTVVLENVNDLHLDEVDLDGKSLLEWEGGDCSWGITTLQINDSSASMKTIARILVSCDALRAFSFRNPGSECGRWPFYFRIMSQGLRKHQSYLEFLELEDSGNADIFDSLSLYTKLKYLKFPVPLLLGVREPLEEVPPECSFDGLLPPNLETLCIVLGSDINIWTEDIGLRLNSLVSECVRVVVKVVQLKISAMAMAGDPRLPDFAVDPEALKARFGACGIDFDYRVDLSDMPLQDHGFILYDDDVGISSVQLLERIVARNDQYLKHIYDYRWQRFHGMKYPDFERPVPLHDTACLKEDRQAFLERIITNPDMQPPKVRGSSDIMSGFMFAFTR